MEENFFAVIIYKPSVENKILKSCIKDCFKINGKQRIIMPKKENSLNAKLVQEK